LVVELLRDPLTAVVPPVAADPPRLQPLAPLSEKSVRMEVETSTPLAVAPEPSTPFTARLREALLEVELARTLEPLVSRREELEPLVLMALLSPLVREALEVALAP
jgi:hypothetical protein